MVPELPKLCFIAIRDIIHHEQHDEQRTPPLIERIRESGLLRNPPIVTPLGDGTGRYMVLDGANRTTALREMGFPDMLVQLVASDHPGLKLENWNHVIWGMEPVKLVLRMREVEGINLVSMEEAFIQPNIMQDCSLAQLQLRRGDTYTLCTGAEELVMRVDLLNAIVDLYKDEAMLDRTSVRDIHSLAGLYKDLSALVIFPQFQMADVLSLAGQGYLLPTGITRFTVSPRALHLNYPLYELAADRPVEEKNAALQEWIQKRLAQKGVRYYAEATFLYDE